MVLNAPSLRLPAALAAPLFAGGWLAAPSPTVAAALAAAAPNTRHAWAADWGVYRDWARGPAARQWPDPSERLTLPIPPEVLARFVVEQRDGSGAADGRPRSLNTVRRYLATLATLHRLLDLPDPAGHPLVRHTLQAAARGAGGATQAAPLRWAHLAEIVALLPDDLAGWRDRALLAVGHNTLARRAELVALDLADLTWQPDGAATVALRPTKTDLEARVDVRYLTPPTAALVRGWLDRSGLRAGPLFVRLQRNGQARLSNGQRGAGRRLADAGQRLTPAAVNGIVKAAAGRRRRRAATWSSRPTWIRRPAPDCGRPTRRPTAGTRCGWARPRIWRRPASAPQRSSRPAAGRTGA